MSNILDDFFNVKTQIVTEQQNAFANEFRPAAKKGKAGVYKAVIRFLPNPEDPANKCIVSKNTVFLENPLTNTKMEVDCPSSIGQNSILQNTFFQLRGASNAVLQENSKQFSRRQRFASLIQVLSCESEPTLVNKILVWRYGYKIHEKIAAELNPPAGFVPEGGPRNPFDLFRGRPMNITVKEVSGFNNFDSCAFMDASPEQSAMRMIMNDAAGTPQVYTVTPAACATPESRQMVFNYLKDNAPSLEPFEYHEWTADITEFVNQCIRIYSDPQATLNAKAAQQNPGTPMQPSMSGAPAAMPNMQAFNQPQSTPVMPTATQIAPQMPFGDAFPQPAAQPVASQPAVPSFQLGVTPETISGTDPRGFNGTEIPSSVNDVLNPVTAPKPAAQPAGVPSLDDLLNSTMV